MGHKFSYEVLYKRYKDLREDYESLKEEKNSLEKEQKREILIMQKLKRELIETSILLEEAMKEIKR